MLVMSSRKYVCVILICTVSALPQANDTSKIDMLLMTAGFPYAQAMNGYVKLERSIYETDALVADDKTIKQLMTSQSLGILVYKDSVDLFFEKKGLCFDLEKTMLSVHQLSLI